MKKIILLLLISLSFQSFSRQSFWFEGSVDQALIKAKKQNKLLFLYWGAVWCPPCNRVKNNIFKKDAFHKVIKNYIPVFLDGDTPRAQVWGEKLKAKGYPTLLVLDHNQREVSRLNASMDIKGFVSSLNSLSSSNGVKNLLLKVLTKKKISIEAWQLLTNYAWDQDHQKILGETPEGALENLEKIYVQSKLQKNPNDLKFFLLYLSKLTELDKSPNQTLLPQMKLDWKKLFDDKKNVANHADALIFGHKKIRATISLKNDSDIDKELSLLAELYDVTSLPLSLRISSLGPQAKQHSRLLGQSKKSIANLEKKTMLLVKKISNAQEFQATMSDAIYLHYELENYPFAIKLTQMAINGSSSPFYFMNYMTLIYKKLNKPSEVLQWSRRGWETAKGSSTILEQSVRHIENLVKYKPEALLIFSSLSRLLEQTAKSKELVQGRGKSYLTRLNKKFKTLPPSQQLLLKQQSQIFCSKRKLNCEKSSALLF